jgi:hypothetical protein
MKLGAQVTRAPQGEDWGLDAHDPRSDRPITQNPLRRSCFHLTGKAFARVGHQGFVSLVPRAAQGVYRQHYPKTQIDRGHHGRQHAHIGLAAGDDQGAKSLAAQSRRLARIGESGVNRLVAGRRANTGKGFGQFEEARVQCVARSSARALRVE